MYNRIHLSVCVVPFNSSKHSFVVISISPSFSTTQYMVDPFSSYTQLPPLKAFHHTVNSFSMNTIPVSYKCYSKAFILLFGSLPDFVFIMFHTSSIEFKSAELPGQTNILTHPSIMQRTVDFDQRHGAWSFINMYSLQGNTTYSHCILISHNIISF